MTPAPDINISLGKSLFTLYIMHLKVASNSFMYGYILNKLTCIIATSCGLTGSLGHEGLHLLPAIKKVIVSDVSFLSQKTSILSFLFKRGKFLHENNGLLGLSVKTIVSRNTTRLLLESKTMGLSSSLGRETVVTGKGVTSAWRKLSCETVQLQSSALVITKQKYFISL